VQNTNTIVNTITKCTNKKQRNSAVILQTDTPHRYKKHSLNIPNTLNTNQTIKIFHQNIRSLRNKTNELSCHIQDDPPHIICISEHHLKEFELQLTHLANYSLGASYCRKNFLKGGVSIFVHRNLKYNNINIDEHNIDKDIEACAIQLDSTFNKLCILAIYRSPKGDFTNFLK